MERNRAKRVSTKPFIYHRFLGSHLMKSILHGIIGPGPGGNGLGGIGPGGSGPGPGGMSSCMPSFGSMF
jgi:hypothetical protein